MDKVILGFLMFRVLSQYDIRKALQKEVSPFYQASLGSIQSALSKLEQLGFVSVEYNIESKRKKNLYCITESGVEAFKEWMQGPFGKTKFDAEVSTRLFFLGVMPKEERIEIVKSIIDFLEIAIERFRTGQNEYIQFEYEKRYKDVVKYQLETLSLGINSYEATLSWFKSLLEKEEANGS